MELPSIFCLYWYYCVGAGKSTIISILDALGLYLSVKRWKRRGLWDKRWINRCLFPDRVGIVAFVLNMIEVLFPVCTLTWRANNYVSRQQKSIKRRNESTIFDFIVIGEINIFVIQLNVLHWKRFSIKRKTTFCHDQEFNWNKNLLSLQNSRVFCPFWNYGNGKKHVKDGNCFKGNARNHLKKPVAEQLPSWKYRVLHHADFWRDRGQCH